MPNNMFSHLTRGYGTWQGIAKLEKPESALSPVSNDLRSANLILPPITQDRQPLCEQLQYDYPYHTDNIKLPKVDRDADIIDIPKTYTTKSGALLLYSEACFVPGSRRMKKRPRRRTRKEKKIRTLRDLTNLIVDYKKNECDPLLLEHLWRRSNYSARDLRPGFSPQRYLSILLQSNALDDDYLKRLLETGSLKSFGEPTTDYKGFLPTLNKNGQFNDKMLHQRPQPYTTMSLPPVSPSSSMLGSFTFYKRGMSTGAASMVSMSSVNDESMDGQYSVKTSGTNVESLSERLAEVEPDPGFKQSYESLSPQEKEDLLTQLLMDITLHNAGDLAQHIPYNSPAESTTMSTLLTNASRSLSSIGGGDLYKSASDSSKSVGMLKSDSKSTISSSVCSLPPIKPMVAAQDITGSTGGDGGMGGDHDGGGDGRVEGADEFDKSSSSGSGLDLTQDDLVVEINGINIEIADGSVGLGETEKQVLNRKHSDEMSQYSLLSALEIEDGEEIQQWGDEVKSLKSLEDSGHFSHKSGDSGVIAPKDGVWPDGSGDEVVRPDSSQGSDKDMVDHAGTTEDGDDQHVVVTVQGDGSYHDGESGGQSGEEYTKGDQSGDITEQDGGQMGVIRNGDISGGDSGIPVVITTSDSSSEDHGNGTRLDGSLEVPHISLSSLHDEVKQVAGDVLSRPRSGLSLSEDAKMATALLMGRIEGLLGPVMTDNIRVSSARPRKLRPLGHPRNSEVDQKRSAFIKGERTIKSAGPTLAAGNFTRQTQGTLLLKPDVEQVGEGSVPEKASPLEEKAAPDRTEDLKKDSEDEINLDDIIISTDENKDSTTDIPETKPEETTDDLLTVTDLKTDEQPPADEKTKDPDVKSKKEQTKKQAKGKKGLTSKKGNVTKSKTKKKGNAKSQAAPKTTPFHAGLVPQQKPPKGLDIKHEEPNMKMAHAETNAEARELETAVEIKETSPDSETRVVRVDSETVLRQEIAASRKTPSTPHSTVEDTSTLETKTPSSLGTTPSLQLELSTPRDKTPSSFTETEREKSPSLVDEGIPSSREQTPSPREQTPSPDNEEAVPLELQTEAAGPTELQQEVVSERTKRTNARAAQRAAAAERRRQEVERKRREREEARRKAQEEEARLEQLRIEAEEEMRKRGEERRTRRERDEVERKRVEAEERERLDRERLLLERQKAVRDEWSKKKEHIIAQRKLEEEMRKEREHLELEMEEQRRREYEERIAHLEDEERERLMEERRLEEERIKREIEEERLRREEERERVLEERRRVEEELEALRQRQLARQTFLESLWKEYSDIMLDQRTTRAFTFSYFDYLPWLKERFSDVDERPVSSGLENVREVDIDNREIESTSMELGS